MAVEPDHFLRLQQCHIEQKTKRIKTMAARKLGEFEGGFRNELCRLQRTTISF